MKVLLSVISFVLLLVFQPWETHAATSKYTYEKMVNEIKKLKKEHPTLIDYHSLGKTDYGRDVWAVKLGDGERTIFLNGSHHAREWMTTQLLMRMIEEYAEAYEKDKRIGKYNVYDMLNEYTVWFVPMVNPDGVTLQQKGLSAFPKSVHAKLIAMNNGSKNFSRWKANANGVDLNRQYPANWYSHSEVSKPFWWGYKGKKPFQEKEVQYIRDFTYKIKPDFATAYHSTGEILYWYFHNKYKSRDYQLAKEFSKITGYRLVPSEGYHSGKGYTDWFIQEFHKPGFTPEISPWINNGPVPQKYFPKIWNENKTIGLWMVAKSHELFYKDSTKNINAKIKLDKNHHLYKSPTLDAITYHKVSPQVVTAEKRKGENWFLIKTWQGKRWIYVTDVENKLYGQSFLDVPASFWAKKVIDYANENGYMVGSGVYFRPNEPISRAQAAAVISRLFNFPKEGSKTPSFKDVSENHWAFNAIETIKANNIIKGKGNGIYDPNAPVTRQQMAAIIANLFNEELPSATVKPFKDVDIELWSVDAISFVKEKGIFNGSDGKFLPNNALTRAQFAAVINRLEKHNLQEKINQPPKELEVGLEEEQQEVKDKIDDSLNEKEGEQDIVEQADETQNEEVNVEEKNA